MKKLLSLFLFFAIGLAATACSRSSNNLPAPTPTAEESATPTPQESPESEDNSSMKNLVLTVDGAELTVSWEDNQAVAGLAEYVQEKDILVSTSRYGGFEQVGSLPQSFSSSDRQITTSPGDIVLYTSDQMVLFYGSNSWSYTKLGHIEGLTRQELTDLLGKDSVEVRLTAN